MAYLDDIICWVDTLQEMEQIIGLITAVLDEAGLRLNGKKSYFRT